MRIHVYEKTIIKYVYKSFSDFEKAIDAVVV